MLAEELEGVQRTGAMVAVKIIAPVGVQFGVTAGELAQGQQPGARNSGNAEFVRFAHIDELQPGLEAVQRALEFLDGDFAGFGCRRQRGWAGRPGRLAGGVGKAAKGLVVNKPGNGRALSAGRALRGRAAV